MRPFFALLPFLILAVRAADFEEAARQLARRMDTVLQPREAVAISTQNLSSLNGRDLLLARRRFEAALRELGHRPAASGTEIRLTAAENLDSLLLIADMRRDGDRTARIVSIPKAAADTQGRRTMQMSITHELLLERPDPVLDLAVRESTMLVLESSRLTLTSAGRTVSLPLDVKPQRDPRGRLRMETDGFRAWLPGAACEGKMEPFELRCQAPGTPWPVAAGALSAEASANPDRNWFEPPLITSEGRLPASTPFYSAALAGERDAPLWVLSLTDGQKQIFSRTFQTRKAFSGYGGDLASVESGCGRGRQLLLTRQSAPEEPDSVQAFELVDDRPVAVSDPFETPGPVTALWSEESGKSAIAVSRNTGTGAYEVHRLAVVCGR